MLIGSDSLWVLSATPNEQVQGRDGSFYGTATGKPPTLLTLKV